MTTPKVNIANVITGWACILLTSIIVFITAYSIFVPTSRFTDEGVVKGKIETVDVTSTNFDDRVLTVYKFTAVNDKGKVKEFNKDAKNVKWFYCAGCGGKLHGRPEFSTLPNEDLNERERFQLEQFTKYNKVYVIRWYSCVGLWICLSVICIIITCIYIFGNCSDSECYLDCPLGAYCASRVDPEWSEYSWHGREKWYQAREFWLPKLWLFLGYSKKDIDDYINSLPTNNSYCGHNYRTLCRDGFEEYLKTKEEIS